MKYTASPLNKRNGDMNIQDKLPALNESSLNQMLIDSKNLVNWIIDKLHDIEAQNPVKKDRIALLLYDIALEHFFGIVHLIDARIYAPSFNLLRSSFESVIRSGWIQFGATDDQIKDFIATDNINLKFSQLIETINTHTDFSDLHLNALYDSSWKAMNSYTHSGCLQIGRRLNGHIIEPDYEDIEIIEVLKTSGSFALIALRQIARITNNSELIEETRKLLASDNK